MASAQRLKRQRMCLTHVLFDRIDALTASLEERLERFYSKTLADSARSLASLLRAKSALNSALFRASELSTAEALYDDLVKRIAKLSGYTEKELRTIFKKAGFESIRDEQAIIGKLGLEVPELAESKQLTEFNSVFAAQMWSCRISLDHRIPERTHLSPLR